MTTRERGPRRGVDGAATGIEDAAAETDADAFRRRLAGGDYRGLFEEPLPEVMAQAAAERGLETEVGALRLVLARLLAEETDLGKLALGIARVTTASARLAQTRRALGDGATSEWEEAMQAALDDLDAEFAEEDRARAARPER